MTSLASKASARPEPLVPSGVLGMLVFVFTEVMLFTGMISAFLIVKANAPFGWPPPGQPRLPIEATAISTLVLITSGVVLFVAGRRMARARDSVKAPLFLAVALGAAFLLAQGAEWAALLAQGLTLTSSTLGSFFYLIVGCHALHAVGAMGALVWALARARRGALTEPQLWTVQTLWYFVVGIWPVLYVEVYL